MTDAYKRNSKWISCKTCPYDENKIFYFRRKFIAEKGSMGLRIRVSADSRYKLYINETLVSLGPCKGDTWATFYEIVDLTDYLETGCNVIAAEVLHFMDYATNTTSHKGPFSIPRTVRAAFLLDGILLDENGSAVEDLGTDSRWKVWQEEGVKFTTPYFSELSGAFEHVDFKYMPLDWKSKKFDDAQWMGAEELFDSWIDRMSSSDYGLLSPWILKESPIPQLTRDFREFKAVTKADGQKNDVEDFILNKNAVKFLPGTCLSFEIDAGELTTGYFKIHLSGGQGSTVKILYSECYESYRDGKFVKGIRDDSTGILRGDSDMLEPDGRDIYYETYWFRTFRFIRIEISTGHQELLLKDIHYLETGYPLEVKGSFASSDDTHSKLWDVSLRTLKRCMHETYEDCPYYEQLQYIFDDRLMILFTYQISTDDRLARKCIHAFHSSLNPDGLLQASYHSIGKQIIPGFCLHWMFMLEEHLMYFGDVDFIKKYRPTIDAILGWFERNTNESGLVARTGYWSFVDWVKEWDLSSVPTANRVGPITVYSLMYACALQSAAFINKVTGRSAIADEYLSRSGDVIAAVKTQCYDADRRLFTDGPGVYEFSQHVQVWAIVCGAAKGDEAKELMQKALDADISKVAYGMTFFLFRAMEKTGLYCKMDELLNPWREILDMRLTTWVEDPVTQRSECHGWGSIPLYEFPAMVLGVKPDEPGYGRIKIQPHIGRLLHARGKVATKKGVISVEWEIEGDEFKIHVISPEDVEKIIVLPDAGVHYVKDGVISLKCKV